MSGADPEGLVEFEAGGETYTACFKFRAIKALERHYDLPFAQALAKVFPQLDPKDAGDTAKMAAASANIRVSEIGTMFGFALLSHHQLSEDEVDGLIEEIGVQRAALILSEAVTAGMAGEDDDTSTSRPPRPSRKK